jgi:hypothetical protein
VSTEGVERIFALAEWEDDDQPAHLSKRVLAGTTSRMPSRGADNERVVSS